MPSRCAFKVCKGKNKYSFKIPEPAVLKEKWINFFKDHNLSVTYEDKIYLCERHFDNENINFSNPQRVRLCTDAYPKYPLASISKNFSATPSDNVSEGTIFKIADVQSGVEMKIEKEKPPSLKVKNISEINEASSTSQQQIPMNSRIMKVHFPKQILVKRINTTTKPAMSRAAIQEAVKVTRPPNQPQNVVEIPAPKYTNVKSYIKYLEDQNKEMKKLLTDTRTEVTHLGTRLNFLADTLNSALLKMSRKPPEHTYLIQKSQPPASTSDSQKINNVNGKTNNNVAILDMKRNQSPCRIPVFPIKGPNSLKQFEVDLGNRDFNQYVYNKLLNMNKDMDISKGDILSATLRSIVNLDVLGFFNWDQLTSTSAPPSTQPIFFKAFNRFKYLYVRLICSLSNLLYGKNIFGRGVEQFLRTKVIEQGKLRQQKLDRAAGSQNMRVIKMRSSENENKLLYVDMKPEKNDIVWNDEGEEESEEMQMMEVESEPEDENSMDNEFFNC